MIVRQADQVPGVAVRMDGAEGITFRMLIGGEQGAPNFYMRQFTVAPGGHTPRHSHAWEHEVYVLAGRGAVWGPDGETPLAAGDCVFVPPYEEHQFLCTGGGELKFLCLVPDTAG